MNLSPIDENDGSLLRPQEMVRQTGIENWQFAMQPRVPQQSVHLLDRVPRGGFRAERSADCRECQLTRVSDAANDINDCAEASSMNLIDCRFEKLSYDGLCAHAGFPFVSEHPDRCPDVRVYS